MKPRMPKYMCFSPVNISILIDSDKISVRMLITGRNKLREKDPLEGATVSAGKSIEVTLFKDLKLLQ